ncbi:MAG: NF038122 family metalloprotease [Planctomycetota bacterium]
MKKRALAACVALLCGSANAHPDHLHITVQNPDAVAEVYATGEQMVLEAETRWSYIHGSSTWGLTQDDLRQMMLDHEVIVAAAQANELPYTVIDTGFARGGFNVIFNVSGNIPSGAAAAIAEVEQAIESQFTDPSTCVISLSFQSLGPGILGGASVNYVNVNWPDARNGLQADNDGDDDTLAFLPSGTTIPVRYNEGSSSVTNETRVFFSRSNFKATIGSLTGTDANIVISTNFTFDFDPSNGISGGAFSFNDVLIHEVGHALGFVSGTDFRNNDIEVLDIWRFTRLDGANDFNPDTLAEFQTTPRTADQFNTDNANSDLISVEYRMSDGTPFQSSHFREQGANIGIMDPAFSGGQTFLSRGYFSQADIDLFDAIGYDVSSVDPTIVTQQPVNQTVCEGETAVFTVGATGENLSFQWFFGDGLSFTPVAGGTSPTLTLNNLTTADTFNFYFCEVTGDGGTVDSDLALLLVNPDPAITDQPNSQTVDEGDPVSFSVSATDAISFQWRRNGSPISGATSSTFSIASATPADDGVYTVAVTNDCDTVVSSAATLTVNPATSDCLADVNGNGVADPGDFNAWVLAFNNQAPECDQNGDGLCNPGDFNAWVLNFNAGCP